MGNPNKEKTKEEEEATKKLKISPGVKH